MIEEVNHFPSVDVIVCFRNERSCIKDNAESILAQDYPQDLFNIVYVNDHSNDGSENLIPSDPKIQVFDLSDRLGKKNAQRLGIKNTKSDFLIFSDADCVYPQTWLRTMISDLLVRNMELLCGSVILIEGTGFLSFYQYMDFKLNMALTQFCLEKAKVALGSAANMIISRRFLGSLGAIPYSEVSSGDDVFLLQTALKVNSKVVGFTANTQASALTTGESTWKNLLVQRRRWMSKYRHFGKREKLFFAGLYTIDVFLILFAALSFWSISAFAFFLGLYLLKTVIYYGMIEDVSLIKLLIFLPAQTGYNFYIGIFSVLFPRPQWKERRVQV